MLLFQQFNKRFFLLFLPILLFRIRILDYYQFFHSFYILILLLTQKEKNYLGEFLQKTRALYSEFYFLYWKWTLNWKSEGCWIYVFFWFSQDLFLSIIFLHPKRLHKEKLSGTMKNIKKIFFWVSFSFKWIYFFLFDDLYVRSPQCLEFLFHFHGVNFMFIYY